MRKSVLRLSRVAISRIGVTWHGALRISVYAPSFARQRKVKNCNGFGLEGNFPSPWKVTFAWKVTPSPRRPQDKSESSLTRRQIDHRHRIRRERVREVAPTERQRHSLVRQGRGAGAGLTLGVILDLGVLPHLGLAVGREVLDGERLGDLGVGIFVDDEQIQMAIGFLDGEDIELGEVARGGYHRATGLDDLAGELLGEIAGVGNVRASGRRSA